VTRGTKNGISEPSSKPEDGDDGITESRSPEDAASDSVAPEPVVPTGNEGTSGERDPDDDLDIPPFLRGSRTGRGA